MSRPHPWATLVLILLFVTLSFNAHACLFPVFTATDQSMAQGCATPEQQPVRQFCDAFKTLGLHSAPELQPGLDYHMTGHAEVAVPALPLDLPTGRTTAVGPPDQSPQSLRLVTSTVLRI